MTTANNKFMPVHKLVGQVMTDLGAHYEILILRFGEYEIHVSCFARILHNGKIRLATPYGDALWKLYRRKYEC